MKRGLMVAGFALLLQTSAILGQGTGAQMPDPKQMSGVPLPSAELSTGTMTVRIVRGSMANPLAGQEVRLTGDSTIVRTTDQAGRAEFTGLRPGATFRAAATIDGERLESQAIVIPANGGVRVALVATDPELEKRAAEDRRLAQGPAQRGTVVLGGESRFVFELGDHAVNAFNILQIVNTARVPVDTEGPLAFDIPDGAEHLTVLEGSSPLATAAGRRVEVKGPFPPGPTLVQFAYEMPYSGSSVQIRQVLPVQLAQLTVVAQKVGNMHLASPQLARHADREAQGQTYIFGQGPAVAPGGAIELTLTGLPHTPSWPRNAALALAALILCGGAFFSLRVAPKSNSPEGRSRLEARREGLFEELTALEENYRGGRVDAASYASRRQGLIASLERIYAALDEEAVA